MAKTERPIPDEFHNPVPHTGVGKSVADAVIGAAIKTGSGVLSVMAGLLAAVLIMYSGYVIYDSFYTTNNAASGSWDLLEYKPEIIDDNPTPLAGMDVLRTINDDYRAWLTVYDTTIDYPVMQGENDLYYASHDIYGESSLTGAIYLAAANDPWLRDSYNLIYGHHMDNTAMFGGLDAFKDEEYFKAHQQGIIVGTSGIYDIEFFAVATADAYEKAIYTVGDRAKDVIEYLASGGGSSEGGIDDTDPTISTEVLIFDEEVAKDAEKVIALSTCASATTNGRLIVFGKMTKRNILMIDAVGYEGIYDGESHTLDVIVSIEEETKITYSIDGGKTWTEEKPDITDVGEVEVLIHAEHPSAGEADASVKLIVHPRPVTVTVGDEFKTFGDPDPEWDVSVTGLLGDDSIEYTVERTPGEDVGSYPIIPSGQEEQGNYIVTYEPGTLVISSAGILAVTATGYTGLYDGQPHYAGYTVNVTEGTLIEFSIDGGITWTTELPYIIDPGQIPVIVRATNPNYGTATATAVLIVYDVPAPENTYLTVIKIWNDNNNADGVRPQQLFMVLSGGGQTRTVQLNAANNWSATVEVPRYNNAGNEINYTWTEPQVDGYTGTSTTNADGVTTITNTRVAPQPVNQQYTLTIHYRYMDGTPAAGDYTATLNQGTPYDVTSPTIQGYTATVVRVTGTMPGWDVEYVVIYIPDEDAPVEISGYRTPLGLGSVFVEIGDCFE